MDLFDEDKAPEQGFSVEVARMLVKIYNKHFTPPEKVMYPYPHIRVAAEYGHTHLKKPLNGLTRKKANELRKHGFDVQLIMPEQYWIISWE